MYAFRLIFVLSVFAATAYQ